MIRSTGKAQPRSGNAGIAIFEFLLATSFLFVAMIGVSDFARVWALSTAVANAAHVGAQYGAQGLDYAADTAGIEQAVKSDLQTSPVIGPTAVSKSGIRGASGVTVKSKRVCECSNGTAVDCDTGACGGGVPSRVYAQVTVETMFQPIFYYPGIPRDIRVARAAVLRAR